METGCSARRVSRQLGHSDCVENSGSERCHLHEDQAQDAIDRPVVKKTPSSTSAEWNQIVFSDEFKFNHSSDDNRVRVWRPRGERLNPAFVLQRHTASTTGGMLLGAIVYNTRSPLVLILGIITAQRYVHDILQPHVLPLMQLFPGAIFQQDNARPHIGMVLQDCLRSITTLPWPASSPNLSPIEYIWNHLGRRVGHPTSLNELEARLQQI
ncbi:transposable element Tcb2 transposase [Trichonephila clavipes]|nr:transposable element Tcb2 transposase [Trichonephila clavipes]